MATLVRLGVIGLVLAVVVAVFAYVGGWLTPERLTPDKLVAAVQGPEAHPGFRRNHAKGVCVSGWFEGNGAASALSKATVFQTGKVPVVGRFALAGPMPAQADTNAQVRSMALRFLPPGGGEWRTGMNNIPVFPVRSPEIFYEFLKATAPDPSTGKPNPDVMKAFLGRHAEVGPALGLLGGRPVSSGFGDAAYNSLDAFELVSASGIATPVRWAMQPVQPFVAAAAEQAGGGNTNYLFDALAAQIHQHPLQWHLLLTVGQRGDPTNDASKPWPAERRHIDAGVLTLDGVSSEDGGACTDINYDPLVLPTGIEPSDDPLLSARSATYSRSFTLRAAEKSKKPPSAVTAQEVRVGGKS